MKYNQPSYGNYSLYKTEHSVLINYMSVGHWLSLSHSEMIELFTDEFIDM